MTHVYLKYAVALIMEDYGLQKEQEITSDIIKKELEKGLNSLSVMPAGDFIGKKEVKFCFSSKKNDAKKYVFLAPNAIAQEKKASNLFKAVLNVCAAESLELKKSYDISQSEVPIAGEFIKLSDKGNLSRGKPKSTVLSQCLALITSTTPYKPCLQYKSIKGKQITTSNTCLIPDLNLPELLDFIKLFKRIRIQKLDSSLMVGKVKCKYAKKLEYEPKRPNIFNGNFPNAPYSSALGAIALLGAIGEMTKEADVSDLAQRVLESLKGCNFYSIEYGDASVFSFNSHIIELAEIGKLRTIVDALYYVVLYNQGIRSSGNSFEYQKFDLFASRFLQMFNRPAFKDFLSFRAEYPNEIELLLKLYFNKMEKIKEEIVISAKALGRWLNKVAYISAINDAQNKSWDDKNKAKAKILVELESSIFSSKSGDALIAHTITRAGRLSGMDAPAEASLFIEKTVSGELPLEQAKNLLIAFSRLKFKKEEAEDQTDSTAEAPQVGDIFEKEDLSNI